VSLLDVGHCTQNGEQYDDFVRHYADVVANIHLHDAKRGGKGHLALGAGELDLGGFLRGLKSSQYRGFLTLETLTEDDTSRSWQLLTHHEQKIWGSA
jgi:sugar phosphate isomerase/epimerase